MFTGQSVLLGSLSPSESSSSNQSAALRQLTVYPGDPALPRVADCVSRAFSDDPLILWLQKPEEARWGELKPAHQRFQRTRLSRDLVDSQVVYASLAGTKLGEHVTGVCVLHPPPKKLSWLDLKAWWRWILSMWKNWWNPLVASDCDQDVWAFVSCWIIYVLTLSSASRSCLLSTMRNSRNIHRVLQNIASGI